MTEKRIIRVFPRRTNATPTDDLVAVKRGPELFDYADEVHVSVAFTWDIPFAERLAEAWKCVAPVKVGGPAYGDTGEEFVPGRYVREGYVIHHRGCPNDCWFCVEKKTALRLLEIHPGWNDISSNLLACPDDHFLGVMKRMAEGKKIYKQRAQFTGGLEAARLTPFHVKHLRKLSPKQMFFAYDSVADLEPLQVAGRMLMDAGWTRASKTLRAYVLCGYPKDTFDLAARRIADTIEAGFLPMAMLYRDKAGKRDAEWREWQRKYARPAMMLRIYGATH